MLSINGDERNDVKMKYSYRLVAMVPCSDTFGVEITNEKHNKTALAQNKKSEMIPSIHVELTETPFVEEELVEQPSKNKMKFLKSVQFNPNEELWRQGLRFRLRNQNSYNNFI